MAAFCNKNKVNSVDGNDNISSFSRSLWVVVFVFFVFSFVFYIYVFEEKRIDKANDLRFRSQILAAELRQSSDDLTRMVRSYVITGDPLYKQHFLEILDIRDGKRPRPVDYQYVYWDFVLADDQRPHPYSNQTIPLLQMMQQAGFTDEEFAKLALAKANSDALTSIEFNAMRLVESTSPATEAHRLEASLMVYSPIYQQAKADIMRPIDEFLRLLDLRTSQAVHTREVVATVVRIIFMSMGGLLLWALWRAYRALHATLGGSVDELYAHIVSLGSGDYCDEIPVPVGMENSVLGWVATTQKKLRQLEVERQVAAEEIRKLAFYDPLTHLPNRRLMNDRLAQMLAASKRRGRYAALMFLDLDNFKTLNDTYGHQAGDCLLVEVANRISSCLREMDTIARLGGDEFVVILSELDSDKVQSKKQAGFVAEKIRLAIAEPYAIPIEQDGCQVEMRHYCTASIGIAMFMDSETSLQDILKQADIAMYRAKKSGCNRFSFYDEIG